MGDGQEETQFCGNCKRNIASINFLMHEAHCRRNIELCTHCQEPVAKSELTDHFNEYHAPVQCDTCNQSLKKEHLQHHQENECSKRTTTCAYCELDLPFCDLAKHTEYCSTRTERCLKCSQYVMHKDLEQHNKSDCKKASANDPASQHRTQGSSGGTGYMSTFTMDEISRMLEDPSIGHKPNNQRVGSQSSGSSRGRGSSLLTHNDIQGTNRRRPNQTTRKTTNQKDLKNTERQRGNPVRRGHGDSFSTERAHNHDSNVDMDQLLAMHLDNELTERGPESDAFGTPPFLSENDNGELSLPCEFCGSLFPEYQLIQHQTSCNETSGGNDADQVLPNNSPRRAPASSEASRALPNMVDNLSYLAAHDRLANADVDDFHLNPGLDEGSLLPCEFCDALFPEDLLIQHQAVCDAGSGFSHHSPNLPRSRGQHRTGNSGGGGYQRPSAAASNRNPRNQKYQTDNVNLLTRSDASEVRVPSYNRKTSNHGRGRGSHTAHTYTGASQSRSNVHAQGPSSFTDYSGGSQRTTTYRQFESNDTNQPDITSQRRLNSASRTQQRLDNFIKDPTAADLNFGREEGATGGADRSVTNRKVQNGSGASTRYRGTRPPGTFSRHHNRSIPTHTLEDSLSDQGQRMRTGQQTHQPTHVAGRGSRGGQHNTSPTDRGRRTRQNRRFPQGDV